MFKDSVKDKVATLHSEEEKIGPELSPPLFIFPELQTSHEKWKDIHSYPKFMAIIKLSFDLLAN